MFVALIALSLAAVSPPPRDPDPIGDAIAEAGKGEEIVTPADRAAIRAKCGASEDHGSTNFTDGALVCPDGRRFDDPETRAMGKRISARADAYVERVMSDPKVKAAIDGTAQREAAKAMRRAKEQMKRFERRR